MKSQFKNVDQVWEAINQGETVYWKNKAYKIYVEENSKNGFFYSSEARQFSTRNEQMLSVRCIENYFGSVLSPNEISELFVEA
jgi:hypothetical protein